MLPQIRSQITFRVESSVISVDSSIADKIMRKIINVLKEKHRTNNESLKNFNNDRIILQNIQNYTWLSIFQKWQTKAKNLIKIP